ncbi:MAG TPA: hypothetical protein VEA15_05310 [Caulobacteraceae bacterium]|nr:hypothetical protein [Caulobacteraceae bacterium]
MVTITDSQTALATEQLAKTARAAEQAGDFDRALGFFRGLCEVEPANPVWAFDAVRVLNKSGRAAEAAEALRQAMRKWPDASRRPEIRAILPVVAPSEEQHRTALGADCPPDEALKRPLIKDDASEDFIVGLGGRKAAVLVFTGLADRIVMPLPLFDRYLAELDLTAIYLRDRKRIGFFNGVKSLADDYDGTIAKLKEVLGAAGVENVHTLGNSAGGIGAVSYGIDLGARTALGFSAPVSITRQAADLDRRTAVFAERLLGDVPPERRDLRQRLMEREGATAVHLYYGSEMPEDLYHASTLDGVPGVTLHPLPGLGGHGALFRMAETGGLRNLFRETYGAA